MKMEDIIKAAWSGKRPHGMKLFEHQFYCEMRLAFLMFQQKRISKEQGEKFKLESIETYRTNKTKWDAIECEFGALD